MSTITYSDPIIIKQDKTNVEFVIKFKGEFKDITDVELNENVIEIDISVTKSKSYVEYLQLFDIIRYDQSKFEINDKSITFKLVKVNEDKEWPSIIVNTKIDKWENIAESVERQERTKDMQTIEGIAKRVGTEQKTDEEREIINRIYTESGGAVLDMSGTKESYQKFLDGQKENKYTY